MGRFRRCVCWVVLGLMVGAPVAADGLKVEPGEWEFTSQTNLPNMPGNGPVVRRECVEESSFSPDDFQKDMQGGCTISDVRTTSSSMKWKLSCPGMPGGMTGQGSFESTGKTITGAMDMNMTVNGQPMNMQVRWNGKRIGPCKP